LPFLNFIRHTDTQTLAASTQYTSVLSSIKGVIAGMFFTVRAAAITGANQATYVPIASLDIQLASGASLIGSYVRLHEDLKIESAEQFANVFNQNSDWYFVSFSTDPVGDYSGGHNSGYQVFDGTEKVVFNTNATIVGGSYQIDVWALSHEHLHIEKGVLSARK
jgi:hypothetical protein